MTASVITVVAGLPGVGKTTWIRQQLASHAGQVAYYCPATHPVPIDQTRLQSELPQVQILLDGQESQLWQLIELEVVIYTEIGYHLAVNSLSLPAALPCRRVAIAPPLTTNTEWHNWATEIVEGMAVTAISTPQIWRSPLTGNVIESESLGVFWYELVRGAYGEVDRAKGIFDLTDGRAVYGDFVAGLPAVDVAELSLPRWLEGRPQRFSGIEVVGRQLDEKAIGQTLKDCCLSDAEIWHYQQLENLRRW